MNVNFFVLFMFKIKFQHHIAIRGFRISIKRLCIISIQKSKGIMRKCHKYFELCFRDSGIKNVI